MAWPVSENSVKTLKNTVFLQYLSWFFLLLMRGTGDLDAQEQEKGVIGKGL